MCHLPGEKDLALTSSELTEVNKFITDFNIQNRTLTDDDRGLSLIIPYPKDDITMVEIAKEVLINYIHLLLSENLEVELIDTRTGDTWNLMGTNCLQWLDKKDATHGALLGW